MTKYRRGTVGRLEAKRANHEAQRALARRLIDIGYKALAKELHPDKGGSSEAMSRLGDVRRRLQMEYGP
jgi:hypothetical protein